MLSRRAFALAAVAATALSAPAVLPTSAQAATTGDACYELVMRPADPNNPTFLSYADQTRLKAQHLGLTADIAFGGEGVLVCGRETTIILNFRYDSVVQTMYRTPVQSVADGTFRIPLETIPDGVIIIPERSPWFVAVTTAQEYGLTVVDDSSRTSIVVKGDPATVFYLWPNAVQA